jgi:uncharacterized protein
MNDLLIHEHSDEIKQIAPKFGAVRIRVFGSLTTGEATESNNVDILADLEVGRDLLDLVGLKRELKALLGRKVDVLEEEGLCPYLRDRILKEVEAL